jgi:methylthioribose-1-phosphate isomerase
MRAHEFDLYWPNASAPSHELEVSVSYAADTVGSVIGARVLSVWELSETELPRRLTPGELAAFVLAAGPALRAYAVAASADRACAAAEAASEGDG